MGWKIFGHALKQKKFKESGKTLHKGTRNKNSTIAFQNFSPSHEARKNGKKLTKLNVHEARKKMEKR